MKSTKKSIGAGIDRERVAESVPARVRPRRRPRDMRQTETRFWKASVNQGKWKWAWENTTLFIMVTQADATAYDAQARAAGKEGNNRRGRFSSDAAIAQKEDKEMGREEGKGRRRGQRGWPGSEKGTRGKEKVVEVIGVTRGSVAEVGSRGLERQMSTDNRESGFGKFFETCR